MDNNELLNKTYQENFVKAIGIAEKYEGAETQYKDLMENLIAVESAVNHVIDDEKPADQKPNAKFWRWLLMMFFHGDKSFTTKLNNRFPNQKYFKKTCRGFITAGDTPVILGDGSKEFEEPRFH